MQSERDCSSKYLYSCSRMKIACEGRMGEASWRLSPADRAEEAVTGKQSGTVGQASTGRQSLKRLPESENCGRAERERNGGKSARR